MAIFWECMVAVVIIALIYMMVRPGSNGPTIVTSLGDALSDLVKVATGYGGLSNGTLPNG